MELTLANFTALPAEPLDQFVWRLHMAVDEYKSRAPVYQLPPYSDRKNFMELLRVLPPFLTDAFMDAFHDFLPFTRVSELLHERLRFDQARRASPIILGRHVPPSPGVGSAPLSSGSFPVAAAAHALASSPVGPSHSGSRRHPTASLCFRCFQQGHWAPDCMGTRVEGCRSCRTAQHTAANCPPRIVNTMHSILWLTPKGGNGSIHRGPSV